MAARLNKNSKNNIKSNNAKSMRTNMTETPESTFADKVREIPEKIKNTWNMMAQRIGEFIINLPEQWCAYAVLIGIAVVILLGLIFIILRKTTYGEMLMSAGFCMEILTLLLCASGLGLPMLMDPARCSIYYVYLINADSSDGWNSLSDFYASFIYNSAKCVIFYLDCVHCWEYDPSGNDQNAGIWFRLCI